MRGMRYIRKHICTRGLACFCVVDFLFCLSSMGIALLLSALLDAATAAVAVGDVSSVVHLALASCLYALVLGALSLASDVLRALIVRDAMVNIREGAARGMIAGASCGRVCDSAEQLTVLGQNMDVLENDCITGSLGILESVFKIAIGCIMLVLINPLVALISLAGMACRRWSHSSSGSACPVSNSRLSRMLKAIMGAYATPPKGAKSYDRFMWSNMRSTS